MLGRRVRGMERSSGAWSVERFGRAAPATPERYAKQSNANEWSGPAEASGYGLTSETPSTLRCHSSRKTSAGSSSVIRRAG
jgi:hypothetical protein